MIRWVPGKIEPEIRSAVSQTDLREWKIVDEIKGHLLAGTYEYDTTDGTIFGYADDAGNYHLTDGHHRINAALEIWWDTGNRDYLDKLLSRGQWADWDDRRSGRLPTRTVWSKLRTLIENWLS